MPVPSALSTEGDRGLRLGVVVPTYRRPDNLARFLAAIADPISRNPDYSLVVVNDGSHDDAYARILEPFRRVVTYLPLAENGGPARARNRGARRSSGDFLVFSDDDCVPPPYWLDRLAAAIHANPGVAVLGGPTRPLESDAPGLVEQFLLHHRMYPMPSYANGSVYCLPSANLAVRADWFEKVCGFDERFAGAGGEDLHLVQSLIRAGAPLRVVESWFTHHDLRETARGACRRSHRHARGTGRHVLIEQQKTHPRMLRNANLVSSLLGLRASSRFWRERFGAKPVSGLRGLAFRGLSLATFLSHELGWWSILRRPSRRRLAREQPGAPPPAVEAPPVTPQTAVRLTVICATYRRPRHLHKLLAALEQPLARNPNYGLVVVNDGSHDDAYAKVIAEFEPHVDYVALPENVGRGPARNVAAARARGDYLVFTDDDCVPPPDWLDRVAATLDRHPDLVAVGGSTLPVPSSRPGLIESFSLERRMYPRPLFRNGRLWCLVTASLAVRRSWFEKLGGMNELFRASDDLNLTYRLRRAGVPIFVDRHWFTYHDQSWTLGELWERMSRYGYWITHQALLADDPIAEAHRPFGSARELLDDLPGELRRNLARELAPERPLRRRLAYSGIDLVRYLAWNTGGVRGFRRARRLRARVGADPLRRGLEAGLSPAAPRND